MARGDLARELEIQRDEVELSVQSGQQPLAYFRQRFLNNLNDANRYAKKRLVREVKRRLKGGLKGEGYAEEYAKDKSKATGRSYTQSGPVDLRHSGRLLNELVGRGRARPSVPSLQVWLDLKHPNRQRPSSAPGGGNITYRKLANILINKKPGPEGNPFEPGKEGRDNIAQGVADRLMGVD